jgi:heme/copper-type cytochrome/quinol oxidase subunit 1
MKKIENVLILPILVLLVLMFLPGTSTIDVHLHDTYYVIAFGHLIKWFLYWLVVVFILYTIIRYRHKRVNTRWAISHIVISFLLIGLVGFLAYAIYNKPRDYVSYVEEWGKWRLYNQMIGFAMLAFLINQIVFLIYFVTRLFQTPEPQ